MKKAIGIDLGTTNSLVAFKDIAVSIKRNKENEELTRSCVGLQNNEILVGSPALELLPRDPINTILSVKRLMGGAIKDKMVQEMMENNYYKFGITVLRSGTDDAVAVVLGGQQYTPEQLSSEILKKLKADAEEKLGGEVTHAVITVPAYFTEKQKNATRLAAQMAGLKVQKLLAEPTAAAIAYGADNLKEGESKTVLIYDFGGGTFDLSILNIVDGQYIEAGTGGDRWLGGDDIDKKIQQLVIEKICDQYNIKDFQGLLENLPLKKRYFIEGTLRMKSEKAKINLSTSQSATISIDNSPLEDENGDLIDVEVIIKREELESIVAPLVDKTISLIDNLLKEVGYDMDMIDNILLVGGTACIPLVKQKLTAKYGVEKVRLCDKPMLAVAEGAAILSHRLDGEYEAVNDTENSLGDFISFSTNHNYYVEIMDSNGKSKDKIIEKQMPLPFEASRIYRTTTNNQKIAKVAIYTEVENDEFEKLGLGYYLLKENLPIGSELIFDFYIDLNENFRLTVYPKGKKQQGAQIIFARGGADEKALSTIDYLIERSVKEYKTTQGEEDLLKFVSQKIKELDTIGTTQVSDEKWHEVYYTSTEKYDEIKANETGSSNKDRLIFKAKRLVGEFGELLDTADRETLIHLITAIQSSIHIEEQDALLFNLNEKTDEYGLLNATLDIEMIAERIIEIPGTSIGNTNKQTDVAKLKQLSEDAKAKFKMRQSSAANELVEEAFVIIHQYKDWL